MNMSNQQEDKQTTQCGSCLEKFTEKEIKNAIACPKCGSNGIPFQIGNDITVTLNVQQARCLTMWAANWAELKKFDPDAMRMLSNIIDIFRKEKPEITFTMGDEMRILRAQFPGAKISKEPQL